VLQRVLVYDHPEEVTNCQLVKQSHHTIMALPNRDSRNSSKLVQRENGKNDVKTIAAILLVCCLFSVLVTCRRWNELVEHHEKIMENKIVHLKDPAQIIYIKPLAHESILSGTMKSCLPQSNPKCKTFISPDYNIQRVVLLAPPGDMTSLLLRLLEVVVGRAQKRRQLENEKREIKMEDRQMEIELVSTTHMAPYGYGKTHGWTRIIRVVPEPFLLGVTNSLQSFRHSQHDITFEDLKASLRQQVRFHCRLSHVAAHTALWTLTTEELVNTPVTELISRIQSFLEIELQSLWKDEENPIDDDLIPPEEMGGPINAMYSWGSSMLTFIQNAHSEEDILEVMDSILMEELSKSKNLTKWPCESFWTVGDASNELQLSPITTQISKAMSPNCSAPFSSCFVKRDKCEAKGDGKCSSR
jgi:hypothetical protein